MHKLLIHEYNIPLKNVKRKVIYHFSDLHLTERNALSDSDEIALSKKQTAFWEDYRRNASITHNEPFEEAQRQIPSVHFKNLISEARNGDALVLTGDILDFIGGANVRLSNELLSDFPAPVLAVCGNHEDAGKMPEKCVLSGIKNPIQTLDLGDLLVLGLDNSGREVTAEQNMAVRSALTGDKPVIIAMHIPFMTDDTEHIFKNIGDGFRLNFGGCSDENLKLLDIIKENRKCCAAVLAGHTHFAINGNITDGVPQYVASQAITGHINRYVIGE